MDTLLDYFFDNRTASGLVLDRQSDKNTVSVAATGFGMDCWAIAAQRGRLEHAEALKWINQAIDATLSHERGGWLYHFTDAGGTPKSYSEISTIDTAIFYFGAKEAARRLQNESLANRVLQLIQEVDLSAMMDEHGYFYHGLSGHGLIECRWDEWNEGVMIYRLFGKEYRPKNINYDLPLFVFYYPLCFLEEEELLVHLRRAADFQKNKYGYWGLTATDGPGGYEVGNPKLLSPLAIWSVSKYLPEAEGILTRLPVHRSVCSYHVDTQWFSSDKLGIDYGCGAILLSDR